MPAIHGIAPEMAADLTGTFWPSDVAPQPASDAPQRPAIVGQRQQVTPMTHAIAMSGGRTARQVIAAHRGPGPFSLNALPTDKPEEDNLVPGIDIGGKPCSYANHTDASVKCGSVPWLSYGAAAVV